MTVTIRQVGPCFAGEVDGIDMRKPLTPRGSGGDPCRHGQIRRAGVPRPEDRRCPAARLHAQPGRDRARHRHQPARGQRGPPAHDLRRRLQPRQEQHAVRPRGPPPAVRHRQPPVALRQLVQGGAGEVFAAARHQHPVQGRQHAVRRHARGLRCAGRGDQGGSRGHGVRAFADVLAPADRLHRLHRRGARALQAGAAAHGAHPAGDRPQVALPVVPCRRHRRLADARRRAATCAT